MSDKTALGISEELRQFIEALVEEVILEGKSFENQKKYLQRFCEAEGMDFACLDNNLMDFFEVAEEWKNNQSKSSLIAMKTLGKDCYVSEECLNWLFHTNAISKLSDAIGLADDQLYPIRKNGEWGYMDRTGKIVFMVEAHHVVDAFDFKEGLARIVVDFKGFRKGEGFIDKSGRIVIDPLFDYVKDFSNSRSIASIYGKLGVIDKGGNWVVGPHYHHIEQPFPDLFICDHYLYDISGKRIELSFSVNIFGHASEGLLPVQEHPSDKWGFINENGELVIEPQYVEIDEHPGFSEGLCAVKKRKWGYIDRTGKMVITKLSFKCLPNRFRNGLSISTIDGKYGVIDKTGKLLFESGKKLDEYHSFDGWDLGVIQDGSNSILVDKTGKQIKVLHNVSIRSRAQCGFLEICSQDGSYQHGLLNSRGVQVVPCEYDSLIIESEHFSRVKKKDKWGLIDNSNGKQVVPCKYDCLYLESDGAGIVEVNGKWGLIDLTDRVIVEPEYEKIRNHGDLLEIVIDGKMGYIDKAGKIVYVES